MKKSDQKLGYILHHFQLFEQGEITEEQLKEAFYNYKKKENE